MAELFGSTGHTQMLDFGRQTLPHLGTDSQDYRWTRYDTLNTWLNRSINSTPCNPVTAHVNQWFLRLFGNTEPGLVCGNAYEVVGYTPNANDLTQAVITLRNPSGHNSWPDGVVPHGITSLSHGDFSMNLATFNRFFSVAPHFSTRYVQKIHGQV